MFFFFFFCFCVFFFFNDTATTEIYTLSLHDALPISFAYLERIAEDVEAVDAHGTGSGRHEAGDDAHGGGFARPVGAEKTNSLAGSDREGGPVDSDKGTVSFG